jgi:hypothetical protein
MTPPEVGFFWIALRNHHVLQAIRRMAAFLPALLLPRISSPTSARRTALLGVAACLMIAGEWPYRHFAWPELIWPSIVALEVPLSLLVAGLWIALAWGIFAMSIAASTAALCLYLAMRAEGCFLTLRNGWMSPLEAGVSALLVLMLVNAIRGASAYRRMTSDGLVTRPGTAATRPS